MTEVAEKLIGEFFSSSGTSYKIAHEDATLLCVNAQHILMRDPIVLHLKSPIHIIGDIHGHLIDLLNIMSTCGPPPTNSFLFLGDYVDRGSESVEVMTLLLALKIKYPKHIYLLRGNHETLETAKEFGFAEECHRKLAPAALSFFVDVFESMPVAAVINSEIFCVHAGLSQGFPHISNIEKLRRPLTIPDTGDISDLFWSDPSPAVKEWGPSPRGGTVCWGASAAHAFMAANSIKTIVRAHQVIREGVGFPFAPDHSVVTVYSASKGAVGPNVAGFLKVDESGALKTGKLPVISPDAYMLVYWADRRASPTMRRAKTPERLTA